MKKLYITLTCWDDTLTRAEMFNYLRTVEHLMNKTARSWGLEPRTRWSCCAITLELVLPHAEAYQAVRQLNARLNRWHYWCRDDEPLEMEWEVK